MKNLFYILFFITYSFFGQNLSLEFNAVGGMVEIGGDGDLLSGQELHSDFTFSAQINPSSTVGDHRRIFLAEGSNRFLINLCPTFVNGGPGETGGVQVIFFPNFEAPQVQLLSTWSAPLNEWSNVTITFDENSTKLYVNGELDSSTSGFNLAVQGNGQPTDYDVWNIGGNGSNYFPGKIENVLLFNYALSQDEVSSIEFSECSSGINNELLIAGWDFNPGEDNDDVVIDFSGNGYNGVIFGDVVYAEEVECNIFGCMSLGDCNYNPEANFDDGSCVGPPGCLDSLFVGYNSSAGCNNQEMCGETVIEYAYVNTISSLQQALDSWNTKIDLDEGWNMFGYSCPEAINLIDGVSNYSESIMIVKDDWGLAYLPEYGFNGIGDLTPGAGYQIKLSPAIDDFSLCDWYVNDIPEDNIVSLQEENDSLQAELDLIYGCVDEIACNYDETAVLDDGSCYNNDLGCGCDVPAPALGYNCDGNQLQVGDIYGGGIIFYIDESGQHGLISAMVDVTEGATDPYGWQLDGYTWGCNTEYIGGINSTSIGAGYQNTINIVDECGDCEGIIAAQAALYAIINNYNDWYLPSRDELMEMYNTIGGGGEHGNIGGFIDDVSPWYFSSSEAAEAHGAWHVNFSDGSMAGWTKSTPARVRAIRSF